MHHERDLSLSFNIILNCTTQPRPQPSLYLSPARTGIRVSFGLRRTFVGILWGAKVWSKEIFVLTGLLFSFFTGFNTFFSVDVKNLFCVHQRIASLQAARNTHTYF